MVYDNISNYLNQDYLMFYMYHKTSDNWCRYLFCSFSIQYKFKFVLMYKYKYILNNINIKNIVNKIKFNIAWGT